MKKITSLLLVAMLAAGLMSGCGDKTTDNPATDTSTSSSAAAQDGTPAADSGDQVEINYLTWRNRPDKHPEILIEAFQAANPDIKVNYQIIKNLDELLQAQQVRLLSGTDMDVTSTRPESIADYVEAGYLMDLVGQDYLGNYIDGTLDRVSIDGGVYGIPGALNVIAVYYNKTLFEENNITVPTNYDEFITACETLKGLGIYAMANGGKDGWPVEFDVYPFFHELIVNDKEIYEKANSGEVKYTDDIFVNTFRSVEAFYKAGYMHPDTMSFTGDDANTLFISGQTAMMCQGEWAAASYDEVDLDFEMGVFAVPAVSSASAVIPVSVGHYESGVTSTKHPEAVQKFLAFMSSQEGATITANQMTAFAAVKGVQMEGDSLMSQFVPLLEQPNVDFFYSSQSPTDNSEMLRLLQELFLGMISAEEVATEMANFHDSNA